MKNFKYILSGLLLALIGLTACTEKNDWVIDDAYNRLFMATKIGISAETTQAEVSWVGSPETEYYIIEISKDELDDETPMGESASSIVYGEDKLITKSPYTIEDLDSSTEYFLRIRCVSSVKSDSKWAYPEDEMFKTKAEQIVTGTKVREEYAELTWTAGLAVTHLEVFNRETEAVEQTIDLTAADIDAGELRVDGLTADTKYTLNLYNNDVRRGYASFQTFPNPPSADVVLNLAPGDSLNQKLMDDIEAAGISSVTISLAPETAFYYADNLKLPADVAFTFFGLAGDTKPVIAIKALTLGSKHDFVKFQNVELSGSYQEQDGATKQADYLLNQSAVTQIKTLTFEGCTIRGYKNTPIRMQGSNPKMINNLVINNCEMEGAKGRTYSFIHIDASSGYGQVKNVLMTNSTLTYSGKCVIYLRNYDSETVTIKNCTFSKVIGAGDYFIDCDKNGVMGGITIENCIFGSTSAETSRGIRSTGSVSVSNTYATKDWVIGNSPISNLIDYDGTEEDLFIDPENGIYRFKDNFFAGRKDAGDPRWREE